MKCNAQKNIDQNKKESILNPQNSSQFKGYHKEEFGSFDASIWQFTKGKTIVNHWSELNQLPANSPESDAISKDMKKRGFAFCGSTICYAFMQAAGMVDDHLEHCFKKLQECVNQQIC